MEKTASIKQLRDALKGIVGKEVRSFICMIDTGDKGSVMVSGNGSAAEFAQLFFHALKNGDIKKALAMALIAQKEEEDDN